jgi:hypothetical protein
VIQFRNLSVARGIVADYQALPPANWRERAINGATPIACTTAANGEAGVATAGYSLPQFFCFFPIFFKFYPHGLRLSSFFGRLAYRQTNNVANPGLDCAANGNFLRSSVKTPQINGTTLTSYRVNQTAW